MSETCNHEGEHSIMIFGVRLTSRINNNNNNNQLSEYQQSPPQVSTSTNASYVSNNVVHALDNVVHAADRSYKCKRGVPWTEEEQKLFLLGLQKLGKGDWKGISRKFVKTRTPIQVASHAQKHFLHRPNQNRRRKKPSVFDLTSETVIESSTIMEDEQIQQETMVPLPPPTSTPYPSTYNGCTLDNPLPISVGPVALPVLPLSRWTDLNDNACSSFTNTVPLKLQSLAPSDDHSPESSGHSSRSASSSAFNSMSAGKSSGGSGGIALPVYMLPEC